MAGIGNAEFFRQFYGEARTSGNLGMVDELLDEGFVNHELSGFAGSHREAYERAVVETRNAFPGWTTEIEDVVSEGEKVAARWCSSGTHTGALSGL